MRKTAALLALALSMGAAPQARSPNVLLLLSDDQRADAVGAFGHPRLRTPNLDRLAKNGTVFTRAYCMGSNVPAVCLPSRTMILTGRTLFRLPAAKDAQTAPLWPRAMKAAGYATLRTGKNNNYPKWAGAAFDRNIDLPRTPTCSATHADNAIGFIRDKRDGKPFFCIVAFAAPHDPRVAPQEFMDLYKPEDVGLPANHLPLHPFDNGEMTVRDERLAPWPRAPEVVRRHLAEYFAVITYMDRQIGRILAALEETGQLESTIILFTSDHGLAIGSHGLFGKQNVYEDGMRVPLIISGPSLPKGRTSDAFAYLLDLFPTACDLAGARIPEGVEGKSLAPVLRGEASKVRDSVFLAYRGVQRAVRDDRWKLIRYPEINRSQLFDLAADPHETKDLAADPRHADELKRMTAILERSQAELGDTAPLTSPDPKDPTFTPPKEKK